MHEIAVHHYYVNNGKAAVKNNQTKAAHRQQDHQTNWTHTVWGRVRTHHLLVVYSRLEQSYCCENTWHQWESHATLVLTEVTPLVKERYGLERHKTCFLWFSFWPNRNEANCTYILNVLSCNWYLKQFSAEKANHNIWTNRRCFSHPPPDFATRGGTWGSTRAEARRRHSCRTRSC